MTLTAAESTLADSSGSARGGADLALTAVVFALAAVVFALLPQRTMHGMDAGYFVHWLEQGQLQYPRHVAYLHCCSALFEALRPYGLSAYQALLLASALGTAMGLAFWFRAALLLTAGSRAKALLVTAAIGLTPAWFYFGTCAEIPGVFLFGVGVAWWAFARWMSAPSLARAVVMGFGCALAGGIHSFGHILSPTFVAFAWLLRWPPVALMARRQQGLHLFVLLLAQGLTAAAMAFWFGAGASGQAADAMHHLEERWRTFAPGTTPAVFVREWLVPFLPWSVLSLLALFVPRARAWGLCVVVGLALHLPLSVLLLGYIDADEFGAYQVALAPAAVMATLVLVPRMGMWLLTALSAGLAIGLAAQNWPDPVATEFVQGVEELHQERPLFLVVGSRHELDGVRTEVENLEAIELTQALGVWLLQREQGVSIEDWFGAWFAQLGAMGRPLLFSRSSQEFFERNQDAELRTFWSEHLPSNYRLVAEQRGGFEGTWVLAKD